MRRFVVLLTCGIMALLCPVSGQSSPDLVHKMAPPFARADLNGRQVDLKQYRGKVILLNFWATWCAPCQVELPRFNTWQQKYGPDGLQVMAISMDDGDGQVRRTVRRLRLDIPVVMGDAKLGGAGGGGRGGPGAF